MMSPRWLLGLPLALASLAPAQELLWTVHTNSGWLNGECLPWFGDYDRDGAEDLLVWSLGGGSYANETLRILSGTNGAVLAQLALSVSMHWSGAGDWDQDGHPDVIVRGGVGGLNLQVWSFAKHAVLLELPNVSVWGSYNGLVCGNVDLDGDGLLDILYSQMDGRLDAFSHYGGLLYSLPMPSLGYAVVSMAGVGDLDGDGGDDFIFGAYEGLSGANYGAVVLVSGATGTILRNHYGTYAGAGINSNVRAAGDVDGDGVMDFAGGNANNPSGHVVIWSGATGAVIRQWAVPVGQLSGYLLAGHDVDLDGRPDIIDISPGFMNVPGQLASLRGRVRTLSSRDGQDLVHVANTEYAVWWGQAYADLGVQPGNPYPVFVLMDNPADLWRPLPYWPRIRAFRCSPAGTRFVGTGCSNTGLRPTIGIRRTDGVPTDHSRLVLGSASPNAFAVLVAAPKAATTAGGMTTPATLDLIGMPDCQLLVPPAVMELRLTGDAGMDRGYAAVDFPCLMLPTGGVEFAAQWVVLDPATLAHATTSRFEFRVQ